MVILTRQKKKNLITQQWKNIWTVQTSEGHEQMLIRYIIKHGSLRLAYVLLMNVRLVKRTE